MISQSSDQPEARVELASRSDVGRVRSANEDSCDAAERADGTRLLVVADGMGGHRGGATASRTAVATISEIFDQDTSSNIEELILRAIQAANARVYEMAQANDDLEGMGTTVVAFLIDARHRATVAHVGDSRAYRCRKGRLEALTIDHSVVAEMHRRGLISADEAATHPRRNEILRSVGVFPEVNIEVAAIGVAPGDRFVLCSDGLSDVVTDGEIAAVVKSETPARAVDALIQMANERGGPDNITVQVLSIPADPAADDPEATAPVEFSEAGIKAIERNRQESKRTRRIVAMTLALLLVTGAYFLWQLLKPSPTSGTSGLPEASLLAPAPARAPDVDTRALEDRLESDRESPRRGIPR